MSAYVCSKKDIDMLVLLFMRGPNSAEYWSNPASTSTFAIYQEDADALGVLLTQENVLSVDYRYSEVCNTPEWLETYTWPYFWHTRPESRPSAVEGLKMVGHYQYQSCEHPAWKTSEAKRLTDALESALICALPGWNEAPWGLSD